MRRMPVLASIILPAFALAGKLDLKQDLSGLDLAVLMVPPDSPDALRITNNTAKAVSCNGRFTGADDTGATRVVTIRPGRAATLRVPGSHADMPRSAELRCAEKPSARN